MKREPKTHDYTRRHWGHDYTITKVLSLGKKLEMAGWGTGMKKGDFILLENGKDSTRYQFDKIEYKSDPHDMWFAIASFSPRTEPAPQVVAG